MPTYNIKIWREVVSTEEVMRTYEAESEEEAIEQARKDAYDFNICCPDDVEEQGGAVECRSWQVDHDDVEVIDGDGA